VKRSSSLAVVVISAACFATLSILTRFAYAAHMEPMPLLVWRFAISALLLGVVAGVRHPRSLLAPPSDIARYSALALTGYGAASMCYFFALKHADASVVAVLLYAYPAFVTVAGWLLMGQKATWQRGVAVVVTFLGCALVVGVLGGSAHADPVGIALGLGAAVGYTLYNLLSHRWLPGRSRLVMMAYTFGISAIGISVITLVAGQSLSPAAWSPAAWPLLLAIVLVPTFAAVVLYLQGIRGLGPAQASVVSTLEPIFTIGLAGVFLGERLGLMQWLGAAFVVAGVVASEMVARTAEEPAAV
jgi:drug/metabolite transporter (DMT)-like permease